MEENKNTFSYSYSAKEQEELKRIREKYVSPKEDKMQTLIRLDKSVTQKATAWSIVVGVIGTLIMGAGMSIAMTTLADRFVSELVAMIVGIAVGIVGLAIAACAYPIYCGITKRERERIAPEILRLTDELMK